MLELERSVRFCLNGADGRTVPPRRSNTFSAWPAMRGLGRFYQLHVHCRGEADPVTGYFLNITAIDAAVRDHVLAYLEDLSAQQSQPAATPMGDMMRQIIDRLQPPLDRTVCRVEFELTPFHRLSIGSHDMDHVIIRQQFEFAAAHRLHVESLGDTENREIFGKCNNPSGHGHNYRLEVALRCPIDEHGHTCPVEQLDDLVAEAVIAKMDHKHLNRDVEPFDKLNPSVENIARVIYGLLGDALDSAKGLLGRSELDEVRVWETTKTVCTYRGDS